MTKLKILATIISLGLLSQPVLAQETATPSAQEIDQNLKQRIQEVVKDKLTTAEENIKELRQRSTLTGYAGIITKINDVSLIVNTSQNKILQITTNEDTNIVRNGQKIKANSLSIDEKIIIIGQLNTEDILSAKRIVAVKNIQPTQKRRSLIGTISDLKTRSLKIKTSDQEFDIEIPKKSNLDIDELQKDQTVLAIIKTDLEDDTHTLITLKSLLQ